MPQRGNSASSLIDILIGLYGTFSVVARGLELVTINKLRRHDPCTQLLAIYSFALHCGCC